MKITHDTRFNIGDKVWLVQQHGRRFYASPVATIESIALLVDTKLTRVRYGVTFPLKLRQKIHDRAEVFEDDTFTSQVHAEAEAVRLNSEAVMPGSQPHHDPASFLEDGRGI